MTGDRRCRKGNTEPPLLEVCLVFNSCCRECSATQDARGMTAKMEHESRHFFGYVQSCVGLAVIEKAEGAWRIDDNISMNIS